ncbi:MAG: hypothetical protein LBS55_00100 [Prevotellaceae bacterium]|jgi:hypothetical protein|nr:hypothetical protein [Prevotellaceae bacterium]
MVGQPPLMRFTLQTSDETLVLTLPPDGYREFSDEWNFSTSPFGFNEKTNSQTLRFVKEGADFLRKQLDLYGISADVNLIVERRKNDWTYEITFDGRLDFNSPYLNECDFFEIKAFEGGMKQALVEKNKTSFEIPLNDTDAVDIEVPEGMKLYESVKYVHNESYFLPGGASPLLRKIRFDFHLDGGSVKTNELIFNSQNNSPFLTTLEYKGEEDSIILYANVTLNINFSIWGLDKSYPIKIYIEEVKSTGTKSQYNLATFYSNDNGDLTISKKIEGTFNITLGKNITSTYTIYIEYKVPQDWFMEGVVYDNNSFDINFFGNANTGAFSFKALSVEHFGKKLLKKIYEGATFLPQFTQGIENNYQLFLTSGDGIRGLTEALIKTSFSDFIKNLNCLYDIGVRPNNKDSEYTVAEKRSVLDRNNELLNLGRVQDIKIEPLDNNWMFNGVKIGYEKQEYDYPLGRQEFAVTLEFTNGLKIPNKVLDLVSKYRADYTGIHLLHYDYMNSDKKDSKSDNDIFLILASLKDGKWQAIKGDSVTIISGMDGDGYFNILLSPHWCLRRKAAYFKSILDKLPKRLKYTSSTETLSDLTSKFGLVIKEKSDEIIPGSEDILFRPFTFKFDCIIPRNLAQLLGDSPSGYFRFQYNNIELKGFPIKVEGSYTDSRQTVTCLAHPDTPNNIQRLLFSKQYTPNSPDDNKISINAMWANKDDDTTVSVSAQFNVSSDIVVSVQCEASYDNGATWEEDFMTAGVLNLTIPAEQTTSNSEPLSNPAGYNLRRFTIVSIKPDKDVEFSYVKDEQVII